MPARTGAWIAILRHVIAAGPGGITRRELYDCEPGKPTKYVSNAISFLVGRGDVRNISDRKPGRYVATRQARPSAAPILFGAAHPARQQRRLDPLAEVDVSRAIVTRDDRVYPCAKWATLPDAPPVGFARLPLGATLSGGKV